jgi:hypothetical protein
VVLMVVAHASDLLVQRHQVLHHLRIRLQWKVIGHN